MTPERWDYTKRYVAEVFGDPDEGLRALGERARAAGLPDIAISPDVGRILALLVTTTSGRKALELGTLGGYSAIWIARALHPQGELITVEADPRAADFAEAELARAGVQDRVRVERGLALDVVARLTQEGAFRDPGLDLAFVDADKLEYPAYWAALRPLIARGGYFVADNVLGTSRWWIDSVEEPARAAVDRLSRTVAVDPDFQSVVLTQREGLLVARRCR